MTVRSAMQGRQPRPRRDDGAVDRARGQAAHVMADRAGGRRGVMGVVLAPPVGYEYWSAHRTLRTLAERLAERGHRAALRLRRHRRFGRRQWDPSRVAHWTLASGMQRPALRGLGVTTLVVIGLRFGATFALLPGRRSVRMQSWPGRRCVRGKRYVRELQLLGLAVPEMEDSPERSGHRAGGARCSRRRRWLIWAGSTWRRCPIAGSPGARRGPRRQAGQHRTP